MLPDTLARRARDWSRPAPQCNEAHVSALRERLLADQRTRTTRGLSVLHVAAGGCGGCALEVGGLDAPRSATNRLGIRFTATPLDADTLLITGAGVRNASGPLLRAYQAMRGPRYVVAVGACAATGIPLAGASLPSLDPPARYALTEDGARSLLPFDLIIRGAPPPPDAILLGLLTLAEAAMTPPAQPVRKSSRNVMQ